MLRSLSIQNYVLIEALKVEFSDKLTIITGETGAGKSIILGALGLVMGQRLEGKVLFEEDKKCVVEAIFDLSNYDLKDFFETNDLDYADLTCIRREVAVGGKSRAFINDTPVKLDSLKDLTAYLIDLHQQFDTLGIDSPRFQLNLVDALASSKETFAQYQSQFRNLRQLKRELQKLKDKLATAERERDFIKHQCDELEAANLQEGEQEALEQEQTQLSHAEDIKRALSAAVQGLLEDENSLSSRVLDLLQPLNQIAAFHPALPSLCERLESLQIEMEELGREFADLADDTEYNPNRLEDIDERLNLLFRLQKKHYVADEAALLSRFIELQNQVTDLEGLEQQIEKRQAQIDKQEDKLWALGQNLAEQRRSMAPAFEQNLQNLLARLSMPHARLQIQFSPQSELQDYGTEEVRFLFSANKGIPPQELRHAVSGGERSRLALCIKSLIAGAVALPTLIFDEIDAGVSGEVARQMGLILEGLAAKHQMMSITHSPQIAGKASLHLFVYKETQDERTRTAIRILESEEDRIHEIAKMLSGDPPPESARLNARALMGLDKALQDS